MFNRFINNPPRPVRDYYFVKGLLLLAACQGLVWGVPALLKWIGGL